MDCPNDLEWKGLYMFTKENTRTFGAWALLVFGAILFYQLVDNIGPVAAFIRRLTNIMSPIFIGFILFYIVNIPMKSVEKHLFSSQRLSAKLRRGLALLTTLFMGLFLLLVFFLFAIPQLAESLGQLINVVPVYAENVTVYLNEQLRNLNVSTDVLTQLESMWANILGTMGNIMMTVANSMGSFVGNFVSGLFNAIMSTVLAIYMLLSKEHLASIFGRMWQAYAHERVKQPVLDLLKIVNKAFEDFVRGQLMEALILGIVCYIGLTLFRFEYALLISFFVGITNIIPILGPYIGAIPSFLLLLMVNPVHALWFIVYIIVLQQIEGNLIYPRVVGDAMGISGFWIMVAVIVGNSLFGVPGILMGIPILSCLYIIIKEDTRRRLDLQKETALEEAEPE